MKNLSIVTMVFLAFCFSACDAERKLTDVENINAAIQAYFPGDSVSNIAVIDTIDIAIIDSSEALLVQVRPLIDESLGNIPMLIDSAKTQLEIAKKEQETTNKIIKSSYDDVIANWENIITEQEKNLENAQVLLERNNDEMAFFKETRKTAKNNMAYFLVTAMINEESKLIAVNPDFKVIRVFEKDDN